VLTDPAGYIRLETKRTRCHLSPRFGPCPVKRAVSGRRANQREPPARRTAGLESLLPLAIIVRLHLATEPTIERVELFSKLPGCYAGLTGE
jgi:hypothetical protein